MRKYLYLMMIQELTCHRAFAEILLVTCCNVIKAEVLITAVLLVEFKPLQYFPLGV